MNLRVLLCIGCLVCLITLVIHAHPSSGIVVNDRGDVFFVHTGKGVAKIERAGGLTYIKRSTGGHWMCLDHDGVFSRTQSKFFERITPDSEKPAIIFADGGAPPAVGRDRKLYFASNWSGTDEHQPGGLTISRLSAEGKLEHVSLALKETLAKESEGVTGLAAGPDGFVYVASPSRIFKLKTDGAIGATIQPGVLNECDEDLPHNWKAPGFRGLDIEENGTIYAAATGCRCIVRITARGEVMTVMKSERPWNPTGVTVHKGDIYVLEWTNANGGADDGWRPRVRKRTADGSISTLIEIRENVGQ